MDTLHLAGQNGKLVSALSKSVIDDWVESQSEVDIIPVEDLDTLLAEFRYQAKSKEFLRGFSSIASIISSSALIWMIMRSYKGLSTIQHRLLLGLCISDIILSVGSATFGTTSPSDVSYVTWNARGNETTCATQGFVNSVGALGGLYYNCSLCLYYLAVVKYRKSDEYIRTKIEPFLHGITVVIALSISIAALVGKHFNDDGTGSCYIPVHYPPHCYGFKEGEIRDGFDIPCGRGLSGAFSSMVAGMVMPFIAAIIIVVSLGIIYGTVYKQEKKLMRYGKGSLNPSSTGTGIGEGSRSGSVFSRFTSVKQPTSRSNNASSQSRAVMHRAFAYSFAWLVSWGLHLIGVMFLLIGTGYPHVLGFLTTVLVPLQGFFNLVIYMLPKVLHARKIQSLSNRHDGKTSWCQAISTSFWSRGKKDNKYALDGARASARANARASARASANASIRLPKTFNFCRLSCCLRSKTKNHAAAAAAATHVNSNVPPATVTKKKLRALIPPQEEEKCEIQPPASSRSTMSSSLTYVSNFPVRLVSKQEEASKVSSESLQMATQGRMGEEAAAAMGRKVVHNDDGHDRDGTGNCDDLPSDQCTEAKGGSEDSEDEKRSSHSEDGKEKDGMNSSDKSPSLSPSDSSPTCTDHQHTEVKGGSGESEEKNISSNSAEKDYGV